MEKVVQQSGKFFTKARLRFLKINYESTFGVDLSPFLGGPVEQADRIESLFVRTSSSKNYYSIVFTVIIHGAV
jgi:hypothetical protein